MILSMHIKLFDLTCENKNVCQALPIFFDTSESQQDCIKYFKCIWVQPFQQSVVCDLIYRVSKIQIQQSAWLLKIIYLLISIVTNLF